MSSEKEMIANQKAMAYDILDRVMDNSKETYTKQEIIDFVRKLVKEKETQP